MKKSLNFFQRFLIWKKNRKINANIRNFVAEYNDKAHPVREETLLPEVLIPCFNQGRYVEAALESIPEGIPITVINDASTDNTPKILLELHQKFGFNLITNPINLLQTGSLNKAIAQSPNNLFIVLNADDVLTKYWITAVISIFQEYPDIFLLGGNSISFSEDTVLKMNNDLPKILSYLPVPRIYRSQNVFEYTTMNSINMTMSGCSFFKSAWSTVGGFWDFDKRVCSFDDRDIQIRVNSLFDIAILDEPSAFYRVTSSLKRAEL